MAAAAPARAPARAPRRAPAKRPARRAPAKRTPARRTPASRGRVVPIAVGRTAVAVRGLPDCGPIVGLTRGRAWIFVLGALLAGIVALNVATLSFTAKVGAIESQITTLQQENSVLRSREARLLSNGQVHQAASALGLVRLGPDEISYRDSDAASVKTAAARLAAGG